MPAASLVYIPDTYRFSTIWWRHQMETFSALLALCVGNSPVTCEFPLQRPVTWNFDVFFDLCLNKWLSKQSWVWWFKTPPPSLWRHCRWPSTLAHNGARSSAGPLLNEKSYIFTRKILCSSMNLYHLYGMDDIIHNGRVDSMFAPSQWETSLQSNTVSHWLGANLESALQW